MKSYTRTIATLCILRFACCLSVLAQPAPMITYQGTLTENGALANGFYDLTFTLYDSDVGAFVEAGPLTNVATPVVNGLFTVMLDFGTGFDGASYWLEIGAATNGGGTFTTLSPRQLITPAPMAFHAGSASTVDMGTLSDPYFLGTTTTSPLELSVNNEPAFRLEYDADGLYPTINVVGGYGLNNAGMGAGGSVIAGGGFAPSPNTIGTDSEFGVISGGVGNTIGDSAPYATISGGAGNVIEESNYGSVMGGGLDNRIRADSFSAAILSGEGNEILEAGWYSVISGGQSNSISDFSDASVISGGEYNQIGTQSWVTVIGGGGGNRVENSPFSVIAGGEENTILSDSDWSVIGGGGNNAIQASALSAVVGGGEHNTVGEFAGYSTIAGGELNDIGVFATDSTIGGGWDNNIGSSSTDSTISGGHHNEIGANSASSTIGGGGNNKIATNSSYSIIGGGTGNHVGSGSHSSTILGGADNEVGVDAPFALAAGTHAKANHAGSFVWADAQNTDFESTAENQFAVRAENGVMIQSTNTALELRGGGRVRVQGAGLGTSTAAFIHRATVGNITANWTAIDHPHSNGDPNAILIVTPSYNPGGTPPNTYNNHPIGVYYAGGKWTIFNQDSAAMAANSAFNVLIIKP